MLGVVPIVVFVVLSMGRRHVAADFDERIFLDVAESIAATGLPVRTYAIDEPTMFFDHTPAWVYYMSLLVAVGGDTLSLARMTALIAAAGTVALVYLISWRVRGIVAGLVGAFVLAINPYFAELAWFARMEIPLSFCAVLATYGIVRWQDGSAGWLWGASLAIAAAVMLKEIALGFLAVATIYVLVVGGGRRAALIVALPSLIAVGAWLVYAQVLDADQLANTFRRWANPAGWDPTDPRGHIDLGTWLTTISSRIVGWPAIALLILGLVLASRPPRVAYLAFGYIALAVAASLVITLKEPRFLIALVPMTALVIGLLPDWDGWLARTKRLIGNVARQPGDRGA